MENLPATRIPQKLRCSSCGSDNVAERTRSDTVDYRGLTLEVEGLLFDVCQSCRRVSENNKQLIYNEGVIKKAYAAERDLLRKRDGLLSGEEIYQIRKHFALTQREAATLFGGGSNAFNKYESGEVLQSVAMDRLLRLVNASGVSGIAFLKSIVQHVRKDFHLSHGAEEVSLSSPAFMTLIVGVSDANATALRIVNPETKHAVFKAVSGCTFSKIDFHRPLLSESHAPALFFSPEIMSSQKLDHLREIPENV